jgi:hypothetical protein
LKRSRLQGGLLVCAGVAVAAALAALSVRDGDAASTMMRHRGESRADAATAGHTPRGRCPRQQPGFLTLVKRGHFSRATEVSEPIAKIADR